jgi:hypothetical protein
MQLVYSILFRDGRVSITFVNFTILIFFLRIIQDGTFTRREVTGIIANSSFVPAFDLICKARAKALS